MKIVIIILAIIGMCIYSYAEEYTYESVDGLPNVGKITTTEIITNVIPDNVTIESLRVKIANERQTMAQALTSYNERIIQSNAKIQLLLTHIVELKKLNVVEIEADVIE